MPALNFSEQFADTVASGAKRQTIRACAHCLPGDTASLRRWAGAPYRSPHVLIGEATCSEVVPVVFRDGVFGIDVVVDGEVLTQRETQRFARDDGFQTIDEMLDFFRQHHGLPFRGDLVTWGDLMPF